MTAHYAEQRKARSDCERSRNVRAAKIKFLTQLRAPADPLGPDAY